jgi:hypothetical protein
VGGIALQNTLASMSEYMKSDITYSDLLPLAISTSLHDSHQMSMLPLLLRLGSSPSRARNVDTILSHDGETR